MTRANGIGHRVRRRMRRWMERRASRREPIRQTWTALADDGGDEGRAGLLLRQAVARQPLSDTELAAIRVRLHRGRVAVVRWTRTSQVVVGLAVMLGAGVLLGAVAKRFWTPSLPPEPASAPRPVRPAAATPVQVRARSQREIASRPPPEEPRPFLRAAPAAGLRRASPAPVTTRARVATVPPAGELSSPASAAISTSSGSASAVSVSPATAALEEESRLLALALRKLRRDDDPSAALAALDQHAARFGRSGALTAEADTARTEALLRLGRHDEARVLLDGLVLAPGGRTRPLLVARAELRAEAGRCADAATDFDRLLQRAAERDTIAERALHGRASCRARAGDIAGARADLESYLARFPDGRFATEARAALGK